MSSRRVHVRSLRIALAFASLCAGCASTPSPTVADFVADPQVRRVPHTALAGRLTGSTLIVESGRVTQRFWHGSDEVIDESRIDKTDFARGRWFVDSGLRYCREMYAGSGSAGLCGAFYQRGDELYFVFDGTQGRRYLTRVRIEKAPRPALAQ